MSLKSSVLFAMCFVSIIFGQKGRKLKLNQLMETFKEYAIEKPEYFFCKNAKLVYVVNSKVACSSLKVALARTDGLDVGFSSYHEVHSHPAMLDHVVYRADEVDFDGYFFSYVRDPYSRLLSAWLNKFNGADINDDNFEFKNYLGGFLKRTDSFPVFVMKIFMIPDELSDRHFVSQTYWLFQKNTRPLDYIGRLESIKFSYADLMARFELPSLERFNTSPSYQKHNYYDYLTYALVKKRYGCDFDGFGYEKLDS
ncbi:MAG: sulfotransferase family 2 domain-containing protein [Pseudomonadota bacterium]